MHKEDVILQFLRLGGRSFLERCLTFGSSSSPGIFDDIAELIVLLTLNILGWRRSSVCRQLDNTIFIGQLLETLRWYETYREVCASLEIRVAEEVADKAFGVTTRGALLGLVFDLSAWTWSMDIPKAEKLLRLLHLIASDKQIRQRDLSKLCGKLNFYMDIFQVYVNSPAG